ncbi:RNase A-like domain-containing protein [Rhizobium sp. 2YAF20]|uniref:RNase A-like domain-containing protein n=1 Tax=Rhizobium sp. 2YAF20 TaxID=3233027 RepID=UPI003F9EA3B2
MRRRAGADLSARLASDPSLTSASSFPNLDTAGKAIANTISDNQATVSSWMGGNSNKLVISTTSESNVGKVMQQGENCIFYNQ